ncbi:MAG: hypothetical protein ACD_79C01434G0013 [uncultured bacterium]|nr:MAG: hypothetical protein ACD_79C01434G0013 [uncultured bacterium]
MSWIHRLYETYENCQSMIGKIEDDSKVPLLPICHTTQKANIEIVIDGEGNFKRARVISKELARTIIPCTENSGGRTSGESPHPLCDKLQYIAADYKNFGGDKKHYYEGYLTQLKEWCNSPCHGHFKVKGVLKYVNNGCVIKDLVAHKILFVGDDGKLLKKWDGNKNEKPSIFNLFQNETWQADAFVRWEVEIAGDDCPKVWEDSELWDCWINYYSSKKNIKTLCYITGIESFVADQHPAKLRNDGDKAKIISSNDWEGFTFRGRFTDTKENNKYQACGINFLVSQKAHSALRWLISRQGYRNYDQAFVAWSIAGKQIPKPWEDPFEMLGVEGLVNDNIGAHDTAQQLALKLKNKISGYKSDLGKTDSIVVIGLDSATPGRMAITYYRELTASDFLKRLEYWHESCAWVHAYKFIEEKQGNKKKNKHIHFVGAPAPKDIAEAVHGNKVNDKLKKATIERILPCIIDGRQIPVDIVESIIRRASNKISMDNWEWNKTLSIACALFRKLNEKEGYEMALNETRTTRDYLYGRLLAVAEHVEDRALYIAGEKRDTTAAKMMQRFSERPFSTWKIIEEALTPYKTRLQAKRSGFLHEKKILLDAIHDLFQEGDYENDKQLTGEYLLGYHCQRSALRPEFNETEDVHSETEKNI